MFEWISLFAALLGAIGGPAAWIAIYHQRRKKSTLNFDVLDRPAFPASRALNREVSLEFENKKVDDPHQVTLYLRPDGPKDISRDRFADRDLTLDIGTSIIAVLDGSTLDGDSFTVDAKSNSVKISPQVLKKGELVSLSVLVQGKPLPRFHGKLEEVDVHPFNHSQCPERRTSLGKWSAGISLAAITLVMSGVIGWVANQQADRRQLELSQLANEVSEATRDARFALSGDPRDLGMAKGILEQLGASAQRACDAASSFGRAASFPREGLTGCYGNTYVGPGLGSNPGGTAPLETLSPLPTQPESSPETPPNGPG